MIRTKKSSCFKLLAGVLIVFAAIVVLMTVGNANAYADEMGDKACTEHEIKLLPGKEPTCTSDGLSEGEFCSVCGEVFKYQETIPAYGHSIEIMWGKEPTCEEYGYTEGQYCYRCGEIIVPQEMLNPLGHDMVFVPETPPTCESEGCGVSIFCARCGMTVLYGEPIPALGHDYEITVQEPTCENGGYTYYRCHRCEISYTGDERAPYGHDFQLNEAESQETLAVYTCLICGFSYTEEREPEAPHEHSYYPVVTDPTCTESGFTTYICKECGDSYDADTKAAIGHYYGNDNVCDECGYNRVVITVAEGYCGGEEDGTNLTWKLTSDGVMTVSGKGAMADYRSNTPWKGYKNDILKVVIENGVTTIGYDAFDACMNLRTVIIGNDVETIEDFAFGRCANLVSVTLGYSVSKIDWLAFCYCNKLVEVINKSSLPITAGGSSYGDIAQSAIEVHTGQSRLVEQNGFLFYTYNKVNYLVAYVGNKTDITLPARYKGQTYEINTCAFYDNESITSVCIGDGVTVIGNSAFSSCGQLSRVELGATVTKLDQSAFSGCTALTFIEIPDSVTEIGGSCFDNCGLTEVIIGSEVIKIGECAFMGCFELKNAVFKMPYGWTVKGMSDMDSTPISDIEDPYRAAEMLQNYSNYVWSRDHAHSFEIMENRAPTCTEDGITVYYCVECGYTYEGEIIPAPGHSYEEMERTPDYIRYDCSVCGNSYYENIEHNYETIEVAPTCTTDGYITYTCTICGYSYQGEVIYAPGHYEIYTDSIEATCTEDGYTASSYCDFCGEVFKERELIPAYGHVNVVIPGHPADCESFGFTDGECCEKCGIILVEPQEIAPLGHDIRRTEAKTPTCMEDGYTESEYCDRCGTVFIEQNIIYAPGHSYKETVVDPTCTEYGYVHYECSECGYYYDNFGIGEPKGHIYIIERMEDGTTYYVCENCGDSGYGVPPGHEHHYYNEATVDPTCTEDGYTIYVCYECGDTYTEIFASAYGHHLERLPGYPAGCDYPGATAGEYCSICGEIFKEPEEIPPRGHDIRYTDGIEATCTEDGYTASECCDRCGQVFMAQTVIPALGHSYDKNTVDPTCASSGYTEYNCTVCGHNYVDDIVEANGHSFGEGIVGEDGKTVYVCDVCGYSYSDVPDDHEHIYTGVNTPATCTERGYTTYFCELCDHGYVSDYVSATGHRTNSDDKYCIYCGIDVYNSVIAEGSCGSGLTWKLTADGTFTVSGSGKMENNGEWKDYKNEIKKVVIGNSVTSVADDAFQYCMNLETVIIGHAVTDIGEFSFGGCANLRSVTLGYNVTKINWLSFVYCPKLVEVVNNSSLDIVAGSSGFGSIAVSAIEVHRGSSKLTYRGDFAFYTFEGINYLVGYKGSDTQLMLPQRYDGQLYEIGGYAFYNSENINFVDIGSGVTKINSGAFSSCYNLSAVFIGKNVTEIENHAFSGCQMLTHIELNGEKLTTIGESAFGQCYSLCEVVIGKNVTYIGKGAFSECSLLTSFIFENLEGWYVINEYMFEEPDRKLDSKLLGDPYSAAELIRNLSWDDYLTIKKEHKFSMEVIAPTCTEEGYTLYTCIECGETYKDEFVPVVAHSYKETDRVNCDITYTCEVCGETYYEYEAHDFVREMVEATCTKDGYEKLTCNNCGESRIENYMPAFGHQEMYFDGMDATCTEDGYTGHSECMYCGEVISKSKPIPAYGHDVYTVPGMEPTCDYPGYSDYSYCTRCYTEFTQMEKLPPLGHSFAEESREPTCTEEGYLRRYCTVCGMEESEYYPMLDHSYDTVVKEPTCTENGYTSYTCTVCGYSYEGDEVYSVGHAYERYEYPVTCTEDGYTECICTVCGDKQIENYMPASGHMYEAHEYHPTCTEDGYTECICTVCGDKQIENYMPASGHMYEAHEYYPTCTEDGYTDYHCVNCGDNYVDGFVPAIGHVYDDDADLECNVCGETRVIAKVVAQGKCGVYTTWVLTDDGILTISGNGDTEDYLVNIAKDQPYRAYQKQITKVVIEEGVTSIGRGAFYSFTAITEVVLPESLIAIHEYAFFGCSKITSIAIPENTFYIGMYALRKTGLKSIIFANTEGWTFANGTMLDTANVKAFTTEMTYKQTCLRPVTAADGEIVASGVFGNKSEFTWTLSYTGVLTVSGQGNMPKFNNVTTPWYGYRGAIRSVVIEEGVTSVGRCAFHTCRAITNITLPNSLETISEYAFYNCQFLEEATIPASVTRIEIFAFRKCFQLKNVTFTLNYGWSAGDTKVSATELNSNAADMLTLVNYSKIWTRDVNAEEEILDPNYVTGGACNTTTKWALTYIDDTKTKMKLTVTGTGVMPKYDTGKTPWYGYLNEIVEIEVSEGITEIGRCSFYGLKFVTKVTLPSTLTVIGDYAFNSCFSLKSIVVPESVTKIGIDAFKKTGIPTDQIPTV